MNSAAPEVPGFEGEFTTLNSGEDIAIQTPSGFTYKIDWILIESPIELQIHAHVSHASVLEVTEQLSKIPIYRVWILRVGLSTTTT